MTPVGECTSGGCQVARYGGCPRMAPRPRCTGRSQRLPPLKGVPVNHIAPSEIGAKLSMDLERCGAMLTQERDTEERDAHIEAIGEETLALPAGPAMKRGV